MSRKAALLRGLFISFLVLLSTGQPGSVSAGTDAIQSPAFTCDGVSEIPREECEALVALYNSTNGPGWSHNDGWLTTGTPCSWYGVTCVNFGHWVGGLDLGNNQLSGAIPPALGNLAKLMLLNLVNNQLSGAIPSALGNLTELSDLHLSGNQLSGAIPPELGNLPNLQWLYLSGNQLSGAIPSALGNLTKLQGLILSSNQLSGALPRSLMNLHLINFLHYNNTHLCEPTDAAFQDWLDSITSLQRTGVSCKYAYLPFCAR